jgi:hypothetical protein
MAHYDTKTKPALQHLQRLVAQGAALSDRKLATDDAAAAGATRHELTEAHGGTDAWNAFVRHLKRAGMTGPKRGPRRSQ